ncbi:hypothetical protein PLICRDRAFT_570633 [Plicaturopsis crispa FD-325 SS-3]|nr:hypothetical protein PLICRDRAFT_570633 [Plicaturopsis crispa FD-325 SS-3]
MRPLRTPPFLKYWERVAFRKQTSTLPLTVTTGHRGLLRAKRSSSVHSNTHECLHILDILLIMFAEVAADDDAQSRATLAGLARSCHAFQEVALDHLWSKLTSVLPLLRCMGPDLWKEKPVRGRIPYVRLELKRAIRQEDWQRCRHYADRVTTLVFGWNDHHLEVTTIQALLAGSPITAFLPRLHTLRWPLNVDKYDTTFPLRLLAGPRLHNLTLSYDSSRTYIGESSLTFLPAICPNLKQFIFADYWDLMPTDLVARVASEWDQLEILALGMLAMPNVSQLSQRSSHLRRLSFSWDENFYPGLVQHDTWHALVLRFPVIEKISVNMQSYHHNLTGCDTFVSLMDTPELLAIEFLFNWNVSSEPLTRAFFVALSQKRSLIIVDVQAERSDEPTLEEEEVRTPASALRCTTVQPIFSCRNISVFRWHCLDGFDIDDGDLEMLASAWPYLIELDLSSACGWTVPSRITLKGIAKLIKLCPGLKSLGIVIDATVVNPVGPDIDPLTPNHAITTIRLGSSAINDASTVAPILGDIFPCLRTLDVWGDGADFELFDGLDNDPVEEYRERWNMVQVLLQERAASAMEIGT